MRDATFLDAGTRGDPLVVRLEERGEIVVGENCRRQAFAPAHDGSVSHAIPSIKPLITVQINRRSCCELGGLGTLDPTTR